MTTRPTPTARVLSDRELSRKTFLRGTGTLVIGLSLGGALTARGAHAAEIPVSPLHTGAVPGPPDPTQVDSWLQINPDNTVTLFHGWAELGQGSPTSIERSPPRSSACP